MFVIFWKKNQCLYQHLDYKNRKKFWYKNFNAVKLVLRQKYIQITRLVPITIYEFINKSVEITNKYGQHADFDNRIQIQLIIIFYIVQWYFDLCNYITFIIWVYQLIYFTLNIFGLIIGKGCYIVLVMTKALLARPSKLCNNYFLKRFLFHFMIKYITVWLAFTACITW